MKKNIITSLFVVSALAVTMCASSAFGYAKNGTGPGDETSPPSRWQIEQDKKKEQQRELELEQLERAAANAYNAYCSSSQAATLAADNYYQFQAKVQAQADLITEIQKNPKGYFETLHSDLKVDELAYVAKVLKEKQDNLEQKKKEFDEAVKLENKPIDNPKAWVKQVIADATTASQRVREQAYQDSKNSERFADSLLSILEEFAKKNPLTPIYVKISKEIQKSVEEQKRDNPGGIAASLDPNSSANQMMKFFKLNGVLFSKNVKDKDVFPLIGQYLVLSKEYNEAMASGRTGDALKLRKEKDTVTNIIAEKFIASKYHPVRSMVTHGFHLYFAKDGYVIGDYNDAESVPFDKLSLNEQDIVMKRMNFLSARHELFIAKKFERLVEEAHLSMDRVFGTEYKKALEDTLQKEQAKLDTMKLEMQRIGHQHTQMRSDVDVKKGVWDTAVKVYNDALVKYGRAPVPLSNSQTYSDPEGRGHKDPEFNRSNPTSPSPKTDQAPRPTSTPQKLKPTHKPTYRPLVLCKWRKGGEFDGGYDFVCD